MGKLTKAEVLAALKAHKFKDKDLKKRAELIEAIKNATEDSIELVEHKATVQIGHCDMDITFEGSHTSGGDISVTSTTTYNQQISSAKHIWLVSGDESVAAYSETRNGLTKALQGTYINGTKNYRYCEKNIQDALSTMAYLYAKNYVSKLNLTYKSSRCNVYEYIPDTDPYELSYWDMYFTYTDKKGKKQRISIGKTFQADMSEENKIEIQFKFEMPNKTWTIIGLLLASAAFIGLIVWGIMQM